MSGSPPQIPRGLKAAFGDGNPSAATETPPPPQPVGGAPCVPHLLTRVVEASVVHSAASDLQRIGGERIGVVAGLVSAGFDAHGEDPLGGAQGKLEVVEARRGKRQGVARPR